MGRGSSNKAATPCWMKTIEFHSNGRDGPVQEATPFLITSPWSCLLGLSKEVYNRYVTQLGFTVTSPQFAELWTTDEDFKSVEVFRHSNHCFGMVRPVALLGNSFQIRSKSCWDSDQLRREDGISRKYLRGKPVMKMSFDYSKHTKAVTTNKLKPNRKIKNSYNLDKSWLVCLQ